MCRRGRVLPGAYLSQHCDFGKAAAGGLSGHRQRRGEGGEGGCLLLVDVCTKTRKMVVDVLREKHPDMNVPPVENPMYADL